MESKKTKSDSIFLKKISKSDLIMDIAGVMFIAVDLIGNVVEINKMACKLLEYKRKEIIGKNWVNNFLPERVRAEVKTILSSELKIADYYENPVLTKSGKERLIYWHNAPVNDDENNIIGYFSSGTDITEQRNLEIKLSASKKIIERSPAVVFRWQNKKNWPVAFVSQNVKNIFGYTAEDFESRVINYIDVIHAYDIHQVEKEVLSNIKKGSSRFTHLPYRIITKNGEVKWVKDETNIIRDVQNNITAFEGIILDITPEINIKQLLEKSEERFTLAIAATNLGIWDWFTNSDTVYLSPILKAQIGYKDNELENKFSTWQNHLHPDEYDEMHKRVDDYLKNPVGQYLSEFRFRHKNGSYVWIRARAEVTKDKNGIVTRLFGSHTDISAKKEAEQKIKQQNIELQKANAEKDKMFSIISHDLLSPFSALLGFSNILSAGIDKNDIEKSNQIAVHINRTAEMTFNLLKDLLEWANLQRDITVVNAEKIYLHSFVNERIQVIENNAVQKEIQIENKTAEKSEIFADKNMLSTILRNLMSNAVKFTNRGGHIIISAEKKENEMQISVKDSGIGIKPENINTLFQIDENKSIVGTAGETGTGLGLILCKEFIEKHGGRIWVESKPEHGSTFTFSIPKKTKLSIP